MMFEIISGAIGIFGTAFGVWQYSKAKESEERLQHSLKNVPEEVSKQLQLILHTIRPTVGETADNRITTYFKDVDDDGVQELLIQYPTGAYASALDVFKYSHGELHGVGNFSANFSPYFEVGDINRDGKTEIVVSYRDMSNGECSAGAPRARVCYRWDQNKSTFVETDLNNHTRRDLLGE